MYKKITLGIISLFSLTQHPYDLSTWLEIKPSYFLFSTPPMNDIYENGGFQIQGSGSIPLYTYPHIPRSSYSRPSSIDIYVSIGYRQASGHALGSCEKTTLSVIPIDIGLKPIVHINNQMYYFFAVGPRFFCFEQCNQSRYVDSLIQSGGVGFFANTGINKIFQNHISLGIFGEYSYEQKQICPTKPNVFSNGKVQIGGFAFGINLGYTF